MSVPGAALPRDRRTVESLRSRWYRDTGSLEAKWDMVALATPKFPSPFSKSMGLTLCGIVLLPGKDVAQCDRAASASAM